MREGWCSGCRWFVDGPDGRCTTCSGPLDLEVSSPELPPRPELEARRRRPRMAYWRPSVPGSVLKVCASCGEEREHAKRSDDGRPKWACRDCARRHAKAWREANWQRKKARDTWKGMIARCHDPEAMRRWARASGVPDVTKYADEGITVCERWRATDGFQRFLEDVGLPPTPEATLDRRNPQRNYTPSNVRWVGPGTQGENRRTTRWIEAPDPTTGEVLRLPLTEWARRLGLTHKAIQERIASGWDPARAVTAPRGSTREPESAGLEPVPF